jgi:hypothetical protein
VVDIPIGVNGSSLGEQTTWNMITFIQHLGQIFQQGLLFSPTEWTDLLTAADAEMHMPGYQPVMPLHVVIGQRV